MAGERFRTGENEGAGHVLETRARDHPADPRSRRRPEIDAAAADLAIDVELCAITAIASMTETSGERLATAISALIARFKIGPDGSAYDDLSLTDSAVVSCVAEAAAAGRDPIQKEVGASLGLPKTTMTSAVKRLSARGLVEQGSGARDARARTLRLTPRGQQLGSSLKDAQIRASMAILQSLPVRDQDRLIRLLETVVAKLPTER